MNQESPTESGASKLKRVLFSSILLLLVVAIAGFAGIKYWLSIPPGIVVQADEGFKKGKATIDPEKLRAWALAEIAKLQPTSNGIVGKAIPNSEIPVYIQNLYSEPPEDAHVFTGSSKSGVTICWGGGFFHWMIDICPTNNIITTGATNNFTTIEWVPGIYYSREDTRHPFK
jgi:hypothetical protein